MLNLQKQQNFLLHQQYKTIKDKIIHKFVDVDFDEEELKMLYSFTREREVEKDIKTIRDYLTKNVKLNKDDVKIEKTDDYIEITANKNVQKSMKVD